MFEYEWKPRPSIRVLLLGLISICTGFKVTKYSQVPDHQVSFLFLLLCMWRSTRTSHCDNQELRTGERLYLLCKSDSEWERCTFRHRLLHSLLIQGGFFDWFRPKSVGDGKIPNKKVKVRVFHRNMWSSIKIYFKFVCLFSAIELVFFSDFSHMI